MNVKCNKVSVNTDIKERERDQHSSLHSDVYVKTIYCMNNSYSNIHVYANLYYLL